MKKYKTIKELPQAIRQSFSEATQKLYLKEFNQYLEAFRQANGRDHTNLPLDRKAHYAALRSLQLDNYTEKKLREKNTDIK